MPLIHHLLSLAMILHQSNLILNFHTTSSLLHLICLFLLTLVKRQNYMNRVPNIRYTLAETDEMTIIFPEKAITKIL